MSVASQLVPVDDEQAMTQMGPHPLSRTLAACGDSLYRYIAVRVGSDSTLADDCMQQTILEAARSRRIPSADEVEPWLRGIAKNVIRRHWRRAKLQARTVPSARSEIACKLAEAIDSQPLPPEWLARREVQDQLRLAITELPAGDQDVIFRFYFTGESYEQIAEALDITPRGVEGRLYRARGALRDKLAHLQDES